MKTLTKIVAFILVCFSLNLAAQNKETDPGWQWARFSNIYHSASYSSSNGGFKTDFDNTIFTFYYYDDSIMIEDTAFYHPTDNPYDCNIAIVKRNSAGGFLKALDIYTTPDNFFYYVEMELDKESNVYLYGVCTDTLFVNSHTVIPPYPGSDVFLLKFDNNLEFKWANTISSTCQDINGGIAISDDNYIYLSADHLCYDHYIANYFNQDSADIYGGLNSLLKIDPEGQIIWRCEIRNDTNMTADVTNTVVGRDGYIYILGYARGDVYIQGDTIKYPASSGFSAATFIVQFDQNGSHHNAFFNTNNDHYDFYIFDSWFNVDENGNYCISGIIQDTLIFGPDTIQVSDDSIYAIIAKMDSFFQPIWYQGVKTSNGAYITFQIELIDDRIAFAFHGKSRFTFMGNEYAFNAVGQVFLGLFSPEGELINLQLTDASIGATLNNFKVENCGNLMIDGQIRGLGHFGNDTLNAGNGNLHYLVKNSLFQSPILAMPTDTANCGPLTLYAPEGHLYYRWNGELSDQNWFLVNNTGTVNLKVADESCCWSEAETHVVIYPLVELSLGPDTTILLTDTLELSMAEEYESYLWSTGVTTPYLIVPASELAIGNNQIWLKVFNGNCYGTDTVNIVVIDNSSVNESDKSLILFYPNPALTFLQIIIKPDVTPDRITIYNQSGIMIFNIRPSNNIIDISDIKSGVYIVEVVFNHEIIRRKLVIN